MNPSYPPQAPGLIEVRHNSTTLILSLVAGLLFFGIGLISLLSGTFSFWLVIGPLLVVAGIVSRSKPHLRLDAGQGALYMYGPFGNTVRTYGAPKGERLFFDGTNVVRVDQAGKQKKIRTGSGNAEDVQRLQHALLSMQQPPGPTG